MEDKHLERQADNLLDNINDTICLLVKKIEELESDLVELLEKHEQALKEAYEKGYQDAIKFYNQFEK